MFTPVPAVPAGPPRSGSLVRSAIIPNDDARWEDGISWRSERCPSATSYDACDSEIPDEVGLGNGGPNYYRPVVLRATDECVTRSGDLGELTGRARRVLEGVTSFWTARELWTGEHSAANPYETPEDGGPVSNRALAQEDGVSVVPGVYSPKHGLGVLEQAARRSDGADLGGGTDTGSQGMDVWLHIPIEVATLVDGLLLREGDLWFTHSGARVVFDAGYPGTAPDGTLTAGQRFIYATGPVQVRLGAITVNEITDHRTNTVQATAERMAAAYFDPCVHFGLAIALPAVS